jgi:hypothetical protein
MVARLSLFILKDEWSEPKFLGGISYDNDKVTYANLRDRLLEEPAKVEFESDFWDKEFNSRIQTEFERLFEVQYEVYVIARDHAKWQRVGESGTMGVAAMEDEALRAEAMANVVDNGVSANLGGVPSDDVSGTSSGDGANPDLKSLLVLKDAVEWYVCAIEKLKSDLKRISLEDHV